MFLVDYTKFKHLRKEHAKIMSRDDPKYKAFKCRCCGAVKQPYYMESTRARLVREQVCFDCDFWLERVKRRLLDGINGRSVIMICDGRQVAYWIEPDDPNPWAFKGFGGSLFVLKYRDGTIVKTRNLWCNGDVPERFKKVLTINAEIVKDPKAYE